MNKKCCQCEAKSLPGLKPKQGLCQKHFDLLVHGAPVATPARTPRRKDRALDREYYQRAGIVG